VSAASAASAASAIRFDGFDATRDIATLGGAPTEATASAIRAMPALGPSPLDRLAEWEKRSDVRDRDSLFRGVCAAGSEAAAGAAAAVGEVRVLGGGVLSSPLSEPFVSQYDDRTAEANTLESYARTVGAIGAVPDVEISYPAADPIGVYRATESHWLLTGGERVFVHLRGRKYLFGAHAVGVTIPRAITAVSALLSELHGTGGEESALRASIEQGFGLAQPHRAWLARGILAFDVAHVPILLSRISGPCAAAVLVRSKRGETAHCECGVLVMGAAGGTRAAHLLVRGKKSARESESFVADQLALLNRVHRSYALTVERVEVPDANETQGAEGSCTVHSLMFALYLVDEHGDAIRNGALDELRAAMALAPAPAYALACRRALGYRVEPSEAAVQAPGDNGSLASIRASRAEVVVRQDAFVEPTGDVVVAERSIARTPEQKKLRDETFAAFRRGLRTVYGREVRGFAPFALAQAYGRPYL
jgi:hypothetical protein